MKKIVSLLLLLSLVSCENTVTTSHQEEIIKTNLQSTIMVATDFHLFSNNLISKDNKIYTKDKITSDGRVQEYDYELVNELVNKVNEIKPEALIITGDLSFNGEQDSHEELIKILNKINDNIKVVVTPGNHDYNNIAPQSIINDQIEYVDGLTIDEFPILYKDFGS